jgi:hypothetical protein
MYWMGDIACEKCGRAYVGAHEGGTFTFPSAPESGNCDCGVRLFPVQDEHGNDTDTYFSGRAVCGPCARLAVATRDMTTELEREMRDEALLAVDADLTSALRAAVRRAF